MANAGKFYFHHETSNSLSGPYGLTPNVNQYSTVLGFEGAPIEQTQVFNEYRIGNGIDGRSAENAVGIRHLWQIQPGLGVTATAERIVPVSGNVTNKQNSITTGISYTANENIKASSRVEWLSSAQTKSWLFTGAFAQKLDENWTILNRGIYSSISNQGTSTGSQHLAQYQSGFAYRPTDTDVWNMIGLVGYKLNQDSTLPKGQQIDERAFIMSLNLNIQPSSQWDIATRYAVKHATDNANGLVSSGWTQLLGGRVTRDVGERWDFGVQAYSLWAIGSRQQAIGAEVGYLLRKNTWVSVGYNLSGFKDTDLSGACYTQKGIFLRLLFKFGGDVFSQEGDLAAPQTHSITPSIFTNGAKDMSLGGNHGL